jgi:hypothetical protein
MTPVAGEKQKLERVAKLLEAAQEYHEKVGEILAEATKIIRGEVGTALNLKLVAGHFEVEWEARYGARYLWAHAKDFAQIKRLLKTATAVEINGRITSYLREPDPFLSKARHPFGLFVSRFNQLTPYKSPAEDLELAAPPTDCRHVPPCKSDQAHTKKQLADTRR